MDHKYRMVLTGQSVMELRRSAESFLEETKSLTKEEKYPYPPEDEQLPLVPQPSAGLAPALPPVSYAQPDHKIPAYRPIDVKGVEFDSRGVPWDARVHSESKATTKDGSWRKRRGVEDSDLARVEAELLRSAGHQTQPVAPTPMVPTAPPPPVSLQPSVQHQFPPVAQQPVVAPLGNAPLSAPAANVIPMAPPVPTAMNVAPIAPVAIVSLAHNAGTFKQNMPMVLAELVKQGKINQEYIGAIKQGCGVQEIWDLTDAQKNELFETLVQYGLVTRMP